MTKVHPNAAASASGAAAATSSGHKKTTSSIDDEVPVVLTVWKKSLLLNCNGFTVFDCQGNLVFRVDNYSARSKDEILLMDAAGTPLLTIRRKRLGLADKWLVYEGESGVKPRYSAKKQVNLVNAKCLAQVSSSCTGGEDQINKYEIEGSYTQRCCGVYDEKRRRVAEIRKKEAAVGGVAFGADVFRLIVHYPEMDPTLAMAFVILLDQMFGSSSS